MTDNLRKLPERSLEEMMGAPESEEPEDVQAELVAALKACVAALERSYDVTDFPADGKTLQDWAIKEARAALAKAGARG